MPRSYTPEQLASKKEYTRAWRKANPDKAKAQNARNRLNQKKEPERWTLARREKYYVKRYGITLADYNALLLQQDGKCAICRTAVCQTGKSLAVDHCHTTGKVRGLLCKDCNIGLGHFKDKLELVEQAFNYLKEHG